MSKIDELINKYCPDGVEYKKIEELTTFEQPTKYIVKNTKYSDEYKTPVLTAGQTFILGYTNEEEGIYNASKEKPVIIFDDFTGSYKWVDFSFKVKSSAMKIITTNGNKMLIRFLYHMMGVINLTSDEHKRLWINIYSQMRIPVPPMEVQSEIVHILDNFTLLTAELTAELTARNKQYEYYKEKLFDFDGEYKKLKDVSKIYDSLHATPQYVEKGYSMIRVADVKFGVVNTKDTLKVNEETFKKFISKYEPKKGDIIISRVGSFGNVCIVGDEKVCLGQNTSIIHPLINQKYLYFYLASKNVQNWIKSNVNGAGYKSLSLANINEIPIKVPSDQRQEKIAKILEQFERICNDILEGLPAEIEARRKQYEYYRDKLLNFKELVNE